MAARRTVPILVLLLTAAATVLDAQTFVRSAAPFQVERADGASYLNPFSGGLWQPRIGLRDDDIDGLHDLFVLNPDNRLRYYRNEGAFRFRRVVPSAYDSVPVRLWFRFADLNGDGRDELLTSGPRSELTMLANSGTQTEPRYVTPAVNILDTSGNTISTQQETVPILVDIDGDADLDLFSGNLEGSISFYENVGTASTPSFTFRARQYMDILVLGGGRARKDDEDAELTHESKHGASVLSFADLDGDGDLDLLFGDTFTRKLLLFENYGSRTEPRFSMDRIDTAFRPNGDDVESEGFNQAVPGDLDRDGDLDIVVSSLLPYSMVQSLTLYENTGTPTGPVMRRRSIDLTGELDVGLYAAPAPIADATRNGVLIGSTAGNILYLERIGSPGVTRWRVEASYPLPRRYQTVPTAGDLNGDGVSELVVGESEGYIRMFRFNGSTLDSVAWQLDTFKANQNASPFLADVDRDGDLDLTVGAGSGRIFYFENTGTRTSPLFERRDPPGALAVLDIGNDAAPRFYDVDGDGDLDALIGGRGGSGEGSRDTLRILLYDQGEYLPSASYPDMFVGRNPVPMVIRLPEGMALFVGDVTGGIHAFIDPSRPSAAPAGVTGAATMVAFEPNVITADATTCLSWNGISGPELLTIVDIGGNIVGQHELLESSGRRYLKLADLPAGVYFYRMDSETADRGGSIRIVR